MLGSHIWLIFDHIYQMLSKHLTYLSFINPGQFTLLASSCDPANLWFVIELVNPSIRSVETTFGLYDTSARHIHKDVEYLYSTFFKYS